MRRIGATGIFLLLSAVALIAAAPARADGVVYTLTGSTNSTLGPVHAEGFQFTAPDFITSYTGLSESELGSCTACALAGTAIEFYPSGSIDTIVPVDLIRFTDANGVVYGFFFAPGDFSASGTYTTSDYPPYIVSIVGSGSPRVGLHEKEKDALSTLIDPVPIQLAASYCEFAKFVKKKSECLSG